jgi:hypothetical protein
MVCGAFLSRANLSGAKSRGSRLQRSKPRRGKPLRVEPVRGDTQGSGCSPGAYFDLSSTTQSAPATTVAAIIVYDEASPTPQPWPLYPDLGTGLRLRPVLVADATFR